MPRITFIDPAGARHEVEVALGERLAARALRAGVPGIYAICGGAAKCATCLVQFTADAGAPAPEDRELRRLAQVRRDLQPRSRLSCQIAMTTALEGQVVRVAQEQG